MRSLLSILVILAAPAFMFVPPAAAADEPAWRWSRPATELYSPAISADGTVAVVRKNHLPDGHGAESYPEKELEAIYSRVDKDPRYADPEIVFLHPPSKDITHVDWG